MEKNHTVLSIPSNVFLRYTHKNSGENKIDCKKRSNLNSKAIFKWRWRNIATQTVPHVVTIMNNSNSPKPKNFGYPKHWLSCSHLKNFLNYFCQVVTLSAPMFTLLHTVVQLQIGYFLKISTSEQLRGVLLDRWSQLIKQLIFLASSSQWRWQQVK